MVWSLDARIPVRLASIDAVGEGDAVLIEGPTSLLASLPDGVPGECFEPEAGGHAPDCACCVARGPAAIALDRLFQRRVRGQTSFFRRVIAVTTTPEGDLAVWSALRNDPVAAARYRLEEAPVGTS